MIQRIHKSLSKTITSIRSNNQIQCQDLGPPGTTQDQLRCLRLRFTLRFFSDLSGVGRYREPLCLNSPKSKRTPIQGSWRKPISYDVNLVNFLNFGLPAQLAHQIRCSRLQTPKVG